jgi:superfamily II DNA or RNA helicase
LITRCRAGLPVCSAPTTIAIAIVTRHRKDGMKPRQLRDYQSEAVDAVEYDWANGIKRVGVVLPTGAGKSTVIGKLVSNSYRNGDRVVMLAHRGELVDQMIRDLKAVDPAIPEQHIGVVRAAQDDHHALIVGATLQTLATAKRRNALGRRDVIIWDEVHHAAAEGYHATFTELGGYEDALMCGFTATMNRSGAETERIGLGDVMEKISYEKDLRWAIDSGFLVPPRGMTVHVPALNKLDEIKNVAGDFNQGDLAEVMEAAVGYTVDAIEKHAADRRSIVFAASVDAAKAIADTLNERGNLAAAWVTGKMGYEDRKPIYDDFRSGDIDVLVTVMVLTEGADFPMCDCVVLGRPTRSLNLYSQMIGRALRLWDGKTDALVLDLSGSARHMKLVHLTELIKGSDIETDDVDEEGEVVCCEWCEMPLADCICEKPEKPIKIQRQGPVEMVPVDLLVGDDTRWLLTPAGVPFIPLPEGWFVYLWPDTRNPYDCESWAVGYANTKTGQRGVKRDDNDEPIYLSRLSAVTAAQAWVVAAGFKLPKITDPWRRGNTAPSEGQERFARSLGIPGYEGMTKGRLGDEISIKLASRITDRYVVSE